MTTFRAQVFSLIERGEFVQHVVRLLSFRDSFDEKTIIYAFHIAVDIDPINAEKRKLLYLKKMEQLLKLADERDHYFYHIPHNCR